MVVLAVVGLAGASLEGWAVVAGAFERPPAQNPGIEGGVERAPARRDEAVVTPAKEGGGPKAIVRS